MHVVVAGLGEQTGDQGTDFSCAENQDSVHDATP
jgi:hypothetical protein